MNGFLKSITLLASVAILSGCSDRPENVASDKKMVKIMTDMELAEAYIQSHGASVSSPETKERIIAYVLEKNKISREEFDSTMSWYGRHIDKYDDLYAKVDRELARRGEKMSGDIQEVNSTDLWPYSRHIFISPKSSSGNISFSFPPSDDLIKGDVLKWKLHPDLSIAGNATLGVTYENGMTNYTNQAFTGSRNYELSLQTDTALEIKKIFGNIRVTNRQNIIKIDSIMLNSVPFDSLEYYRINMLKKYPGPQRKMIKPVVLSTDSTANKEAEAS